ncbi:CorA family divalent cation transporter [Cellulomonas carbonis]|uniref:Magnesium transporter CorA n=1 Tax=Cellulomonas carbonis T26 TaxID=947969 RepID=A0A0A0BST8_9CELL|nr:CorA family divalent cation transporter [Cellulomonas carbonis]KGM10995.1 magnesium transporter CorA [Cellulomonas carbonis T26]
MDSAGAVSVWVRTGGAWAPAPEGYRRAGQEPVWLRVDDPARVVAGAVALGADPDVVRAAGAHALPAPAGRPHVEHLAGGGVYLVTPTVAFRPTESAVVTGTVTCLVVEGLTVTAETPDGAVLDRLAARLPTSPGVADRISSGVLAGLVASLVAGAAEVEVGLAEAVADLETEVFADASATPVERLYALKREVAEARRGLVLLAAELADLVTDVDERAAEDAWVWRPAAVVERLDHRLEGHDRLLGDMLTAHLALVSLRQNDDVRRISAWAAIAAAPTLLASVYGMNFRHMPELGWPIGYPLAVAVMVAVCVVLHRVFTRSGWLGRQASAPASGSSTPVSSRPTTTAASTRRYTTNGR